MTNGIDRSSPPSSATSVWPTQARPRKDANSSIDLMFWADEKPSMNREPTANIVASTISPMKALRFSTNS